MSFTNDGTGLEQKRDELIFELIKRRLDDEQLRINNLDSKAGNMVGFVSIVVGLLLGAGTFNPSTFILKPELSIPYFIGIGILLISIGFALCAIRVRKWVAVPNVETLRKEYTDKPYDEVLKRNAGTMANAVVEAEKQNDSKANLISWSWYCLIAGLCTVFIFVILFAFTGNGAIDGAEVNSQAQ